MVSVMRWPPYEMPLGSVKCPPAIWWHLMTTAAESNGVGLDVEGGARSEAAVLERGGASADRRRGCDAPRVGCGRGAGEWRQREPGLQMDPPFGRQAEIGRSSYWPPRVISA